ncbi:MAG: SMC-Scp complex subunit ScpB [Acidobacteriaceae bacterium]
MSLKARIEAVIYAAEEPVTLQQLAALFREEALLRRAERLAPQADPEAPSEDDEDEGSFLDDLDDEDSPAPLPPATETLEPEVPPMATTSVEPATTADPSAPASEPESSLDDEKRAARQREREVRDELRAIVDELIADYNGADRGLEIREVAGGFRLATRAEYHDAVRSFIKSLKPPLKLSLQALETLAVIAYKQPVTAPEISEIRGVDSGGVLGSLIARKLINTAGRKQVIGRPILYKTTKEFLLRFGLKDINELPSIEEFEKMATELAESEEDAAAIAPSETELPFAQNEIADLEEDAVETRAEAEPPSEEATTENDAASTQE